VLLPVCTSSAFLDAHFSAQNRVRQFIRLRQSIVIKDDSPAGQRVFAWALPLGRLKEHALNEPYRVSNWLNRRPYLFGVWATASAANWHHLKHAPWRNLRASYSCSAEYIVCDGRGKWTLQRDSNCIHYSWRNWNRQQAGFRSTTHIVNMSRQTNRPTSSATAASRSSSCSLVQYSLKSIWQIIRLKWLMLNV